MGKKIIGLCVLVVLLATQFIGVNAGAENVNLTTGYWIHGIVTLDMGKNEKIIDGPGNDVRIHEIPRTEPFDVYVSNNLKN